MPSFVIAEKCDGCKGQDKTACMYICPNDLMFLDMEKMKAYNRDPSMCWECQCCVKICPQQAMDVRGYSDFIPLGASCVPLRGSEDAWFRGYNVDGKIQGRQPQEVQVPHQDNRRGLGRSLGRLYHP